MPDVSIRRVSELIREIEDGTLVLRPPFQRRLVWTNVVKDHFLETVSFGLPFPEIFIATGEIDTKTMKRKNLLVDGQQRISTLRQYVHSSEDLILVKVKPYGELEETEKQRFLDYKVAVRDLGTVTEEQIKDIFSRINSTDYALKAIERLNAQFSGEYKRFCDDLSRNAFFDRHVTFSLADLRRMRDLDFCVILTTTLLSTYYHRDALNREYLTRYNDAFPKGAKLLKEIEAVLDFIESCNFSKKCRIWKKTDLFTAIVELHALDHKRVALSPSIVRDALEPFYAQVDEMFKLGVTDEDSEIREPNAKVFRYLKAATKATNDRYARVERGQIICGLLIPTTDGRKRSSKRTGSTKTVRMKRPARKKNKKKS